MSDQPTPAPDVVRMAVTLRHDTGTVTITTPVIQPADEEEARERAITAVCAAERAPRRAVLSVAREGEPAVPMGAWVIGHNLAGYSPDPDNVSAFASWDEAAGALSDEARRYADEDWDGATDTVPDEDMGDAYDMRATVDSILSDPSFGPGSIDEGHDWSFWAEDSRGRTIAFWLMWSPDQPTPED